MELGPMSYLAFEFEGNKFRGDLMPDLMNLVEHLRGAKVFNGMKAANRRLVGNKFIPGFPARGRERSSLGKGRWVAEPGTAGAGLHGWTVVRVVDDWQTAFRLSIV